MRKLVPIATITLLLLMMGLVGVSNAQLFGRRRAERNFGAGVLFGAGGSCANGMCSIPSASVSSMASVPMSYSAPMMSAPSYAAAPMSYSAAPQTYGAGSGSCYSSSSSQMMSYAPQMSYAPPPQSYAYSAAPQMQAYSVAPPQETQEWVLVPAPKRATGALPQASPQTQESPSLPSKSLPDSSNYRPSKMEMPKSLIEVPDVLKGKVLSRPVRVLRVQTPVARNLGVSPSGHWPRSVLPSEYQRQSTTQTERRPKAYISCEECDGEGGCLCCGDRCSCEHVPVPTKQQKRPSPDWTPKVQSRFASTHETPANGLVDYSGVSSMKRTERVDYSGLADSSRQPTSRVTRRVMPPPGVVTEERTVTIISDLPVEVRYQN